MQFLESKGVAHKPGTGKIAQLTQSKIGHTPTK